MAKSRKPVSTKMVWRIFKFFERFEYTHDSFRKKPLVFIKSFVGSGCDDISAEYFRQMQDLKLYPEYLMLKGMFDDIRDISANAGIKHRGYLLDGMYRPATSKLIGSWVGIDARAANAALKKIETTGLIEQVPMPDFDIDDDPTPPTPPDPPEKPKTKKQIAAEKRKAKADAAKAKKQAADAAKAEKTKPGKKRKKTGKKSRPLNNGKNGKTESLTASGKTANPENAKETALTGQSEQGTEAAKPQPDHHPAADAAKGTTGRLRARTGDKGADINADRPLPPKPTEADGPHSRTPARSDGLFKPTEADGGAVSSKRANAQDDRPPQHNPQPTFEQKYDSRCREFSIAVYMAIRTRHPIGSPEAYRELAVFAQQWQYVQESGIGDERIGILWGKGVEEARSLGNKRRMSKGARCPEAVWVTIFKGRLDDMVGKAMPKVGAG